MAALVASGLKNLPFGDADAVGYFQMRESIWNQGQYAGFPDNPELQIKWFIDQASAVRTARIAADDADFGKNPTHWGGVDRGRRAACGAVPRAIPAPARRGRPVRRARLRKRRVTPNPTPFDPHASDIWRRTP